MHELLAKVDYASLKKGDSLSTPQLVDLFGCAPETDRFRLRLLTLKERIEQERPELYVAARQKGIQILTSKEALCKNLKDLKKTFARVTRLGKASERRIDPAELDEAHRRIHGRLVEYHGNLSLTIVGERSKLNALQKIRESRRLAK